MNAWSGDQIGKCAWRPGGAAKIWRGSSSEECCTNIGSSGAGVWYTRREPSLDQSNSAAPGRYGRGVPPRTGTLQMLISDGPESSNRRAQKVTSVPSGEEPQRSNRRVDEFRGRTARQVVELTGSHLRHPYVHPTVAVRQKRHESTSGEMAAACSVPPNSVRCSKRASASGFSRARSCWPVSRSVHVRRRAAAPAPRPPGSQMPLLRPGGIGEAGDGRMGSTWRAAWRLFVHASSSDRKAYTDPILSCRCLCTGIPSRRSHRWTVVTSRLR